MTQDEKDALYRRYWCNKKGQPVRHAVPQDELDDDDYERLARLARYEDAGSPAPQIPGVNAPLPEQDCGEV
ncbi:hypothetical protein [Mycobacteroides abscessus]|uniref:hypothetical protein n=1 Tax=Mycobacteroides abscessus TaxID=36809 RepID=UPI000C26A56D|nr:hypothetical protein [Mycobacteroides abscessus]